MLACDGNDRIWARWSNRRPLLAQTAYLDSHTIRTITPCQLAADLASPRFDNGGDVRSPGVDPCSARPHAVLPR